MRLLALLSLSGCLVVDNIAATKQAVESPVQEPTPSEVTPAPTGVTGMSGPTGMTGPTGMSGPTGPTAWAGPVLIGASEFHDANASAAGVDIIATLPTGVLEGDLLLLFIGADHSFDTAPNDLATFTNAGWTMMARHIVGTDTQATYLAWRLAGATGPTSYVFSNINPGYHGVQALLRAYRNVSPTGPIQSYVSNEVQSGSTGLADIVTDTPQTSTTLPQSLLIAGMSPDSSVDGPTITTWPAGFDSNRFSVNKPTGDHLSWANIYSAEQRAETPATVPASHFGWHIVATGPDLYYTGCLTFVLVLSPKN